MDTPVTDAMAERFERLEARCNHLESQVRLWRRVGGLTLLGAVVVVGGGAALLENIEVDTVVTKHLVIHDAGGNERMRLEVGGLPAESAGLQILAPSGEQLYLGAWLSGDAAGLKINSPNLPAPPIKRIELGTRPSSVAAPPDALLEFTPPAGLAKVALGMVHDAAGFRSGLVVSDGAGNPRLETITLEGPGSIHAILRNIGPTHDIGAGVPFLRTTDP